VGRTPDAAPAVAAACASPARTYQLKPRYPEQGKWLKSVVTGYYAYHAVPTNVRALGRFRYHVMRLWLRTLRRRSQKDQMTWLGLSEIAANWLPTPRILHPWPSERFAVKHPR